MDYGWTTAVVDCCRTIDYGMRNETGSRGCPVQCLLLFSLLR